MDSAAIPDVADGSARDFPRSSPTIVGIGASAGGLEAFSRLIGELPSDTGLAYVLVQHLDPRHDSMLPELLGRSAAVTVVQAAERMPIEADHAYVIPPNVTMTVADGHLRLVQRQESETPHLSIDAFLCSLAKVHGPGAIGVILSGAGSDGSRGIEAIKLEGGLTMAQDPATARYASMPKSAIETGYVDFVLAPEEIAAQLTKIGRHIADMGTSIPSRERPSAGASDEVNRILLALRNRTGSTSAGTGEQPSTGASCAACSSTGRTRPAVTSSTFATTLTRSTSSTTICSLESRKKLVTPTRSRRSSGTTSRRCWLAIQRTAQSASGSRDVPAAKRRTPSQWSCSRRLATTLPIRPSRSSPRT